MNGKEYLRSFSQMDSQIEILQERIERTRSRLEKVTPTYSAVPGGGGGGNSREEMIASYMDMVEELRQNVDDMRLRQLEVIRTINCIEDDRVKTVLEYRYFKHLMFEDIAKKMGYSVDHVYMLHRIGCREIERILTKSTKNNS